MPYYPPRPMRVPPGTSFHRRILDNPMWIAEPKKDGERCIVVNGQYWSRHGKLLRCQPELRIHPDLVLDGEVVDGEPWFFDIPSSPGYLLARRLVLEQSGLPFAPWMDKETAYETAIQSGEEGIVYKRIDSVYEWQTSDNSQPVIYWAKVKP